MTNNKVLTEEVENKIKEIIQSGLKKEHIYAYLDKKRSEDNIKRFEDVTLEMATMYRKKNKDYGNSIDISLDENGLTATKIRLGDKYRRFSTLVDNDSEVKEESIRDTLLDLANYAVTTVMWMDEEGFDE